MTTNQALQRPLRLNQRRAAIFIDAANLFYSSQELGISIEYRDFKSQLASGFYLTETRYYTGVDSAKPEQLGFLSHLRQIGYEVIAKELVRRSNGSYKANLDVKIALDMTNIVNDYDTAILVSGDGDLVWAVEEIQNRGKLVTVVGLASMTSRELRFVADRFIDLGSGLLSRVVGCPASQP
jgi:uncharacterized LabA/DUF88 family protein